MKRLLLFLTSMAFAGTESLLSPSFVKSIFRTLISDSDQGNSKHFEFLEDIRAYSPEEARILDAMLRFVSDHQQNILFMVKESLTGAAKLFRYPKDLIIQTKIHLIGDNLQKLVEFLSELITNLPDSPESKIFKSEYIRKVNALGTVIWTESGALIQQNDVRYSILLKEFFAAIIDLQSYLIKSCGQDSFNNPNPELILLDNIYDFCQVITDALKVQRRITVFKNNLYYVLCGRIGLIPRLLDDLVAILICLNQYQQYVEDVRSRDLHMIVQVAKERENHLRRELMSNRLIWAILALGNIGEQIGSFKRFNCWPQLFLLAN